MLRIRKRRTASQVADPIIVSRTAATGNLTIFNYVATTRVHSLQWVCHQAIWGPDMNLVLVQLLHGIVTVVNFAIL